jgi:hypothetical protein
LLIILAAWVITYLGAHGMEHRPVPTVPSPVRAVGPKPLLPEKRTAEVFQAARERVKSDNVTGNRFALVAQVSSWLSFLLTAAITLMAGYYGRTVQAGAAPEAAVNALQAQSTRTVRLVGALAALAAIFTGLANRAEAEDSRRYKLGDDLLAAVQQARADIESATTEAAAQKALEELENKAQR